MEPSSLADGLINGVTTLLSVGEISAILPAGHALASGLQWTHSTSAAARFREIVLITSCLVEVSQAVLTPANIGLVGPGPST
jgi:hypothetical protein